MSLTALIPVLGSVIDKIFPDKTAANEAKLKIVEMQQNGELAGLDAQVKAITAEANSQHKLAAIWRPITMLVFVFIIANNYIIYPYLSLFFDAAPKLETPPDLWGLMKLGLGGYVVGRSVEKAVEKWKD